MLHALQLRPDPFSVPLSPLASFIYYGFATGAATFFAFSYTGASFKFVRPFISLPQFATLIIRLSLPTFLQPGPLLWTGSHLQRVA